jgi:uncharacterized protein (TIGR03435 family)
MKVLKGLWFCLALTICLVWGVRTEMLSRPQAASAPLTFEVASVKLADPTNLTGAGRNCHGIDTEGRPTSLIGLGRCHFQHVDLKGLISFSYQIKYEWVLGGAGWVNSVEYAIEAKAADSPAPTSAQLLRMMQLLLEDRFKLKFHRETKEVPGYALVLAKSGTKLKEAIGNDPLQPGGPAMFAGKAVAGVGMLAGPMTTSTIAELLSGSLQAPVIDRTGLNGVYVLNLRWKPMEGEAGFKATDNFDLPSIFTAVEEGLGLRLEPQKVSIDLIVIDHAEKPSGN